MNKLVILLVGIFASGLAFSADLTKSKETTGVVKVKSLLECTKLPKINYLKDTPELFNLVKEMGMLDKSNITGEYAYKKDVNLNLACWIVDEIVKDNIGEKEKIYAKAHFSIDDRFKNISQLKGFACLKKGPIYSRYMSVSLLAPSGINISKKPIKFCDSPHKKESYKDVFEIEERVTRLIELRKSRLTGDLVKNISLF